VNNTNLPPGLHCSKLWLIIGLIFGSDRHSAITLVLMQGKCKQETN